MSDVLSDVAVDLVSKYILGKNPSTPSLELGLFVNNFTPTADSTIGDFLECTAPGYARIALAEADWTGSASSGVAQYAHPPVTFAITGPGVPGQTVYGHFVYDTGSAAVLWSAKWTTAWVIPAGGTTNPTVTPTWKEEECPDA